MKNSIKILALALPFVLGGCSKISAVHDTQAGLATPDQIQKCDLLGQPEKMTSDYPELLDAKWDRDLVGCGAIYAYELARQSTFDIELKLEALAAQLAYFEVLKNAYPKLFRVGELGQELNGLWRATRNRSINLISQVEMFDAFIPEVGLLQGAYILASAEEDSTSKDMVKSMPIGLKFIEQAVADKPEAADGLGLYVLARLKLNLPSFIGGDNKKAVELFEQALSYQPNSLEIHRWLMQAYAATGDVEKEKDIIRKATTMIDKNINDQDLADLYIVYGGSAHRYGMKDEIAFYSASRKTLLADKPYLLTRKSGANLGHGGNDPLTGEDPNAI